MIPNNIIACTIQHAEVGLEDWVAGEFTIMIQPQCTSRLELRAPASRRLLLHVSCLVFWNSQLAYASRFTWIRESRAAFRYCAMCRTVNSYALKRDRHSDATRLPIRSNAKGAGENAARTRSYLRRRKLKMVGSCRDNCMESKVSSSAGQSLESRRA